MKIVGKTKTGYTIVELLVVIVVIGILSTLVFISYQGIAKKAIVANLESELQSAGKLISMYHVEYESFPSSLSAVGCPNGPTQNANYCIKYSEGTNMSYSSGSSSTFTLTYTKNGVVCRITEDLSPYEVGPAPITAIANITGNTQVGQVITAGSIEPSGATVAYQWQSSTTSGGTYTDISGATASTYTLTSNEFKKFIRLVVTGVGDYIGTQTSAETTGYVTNPLTSIGAISGTLQVSQTLTAGSVLPGGATVVYQWQSSSTSDGAYTNLSGATSSTYVVSPVTMNKYLRVAVTGTGDYGGTIFSAATASAIPNDSNWLFVGTQAWSAANLNVGTMITGSVVQSNNAVLEKYCYSNTESNCTTYGGLYRWAEAMQYSGSEGAQGICPGGSHVPSDNDWKIMEMYLGMTQAQADGTNQRGTDQGTKLKVGGSTGMNMQFGGRVNSIGTFMDLGSWGNWWTSTNYNTAGARNRDIGSYAGVERAVVDKVYGLSIRCVGNN